MQTEITTLRNYKISILMNCRNGEKFLKQAIDSVYNQTYQNFEIIFIDNQSTDSTPAIAQSYDQRMKYHRTPTPMTLYQARAYAIQFCSGDYFCVLDADDFWSTDKLYQQVLFLTNHPDVNFVYGAARYFYEEKPLKTVFINSIVSLKKLLTRKGFRCFEDLIGNYDINFQTVMIKMEYVKECGFNSKFNYIGDFDFHLRIMAKFKIKPYYLKKNFSTTRIHNMQLTSTTPGKWLREVKFLLVEVIKPNTSPENARKFMKEISRKRFVYYLSMGKPFCAFKVIRKYLLTDAYLAITVFYKISSFCLKRSL